MPYGVRVQVSPRTPKFCGEFMKTVDLTEKILKQLKAKDIVYAEFAEEGAMGDCGSAGIFTIEKGELKLYYVNVYSDKSKAANRVYEQAWDFLQKLREEEKLEYANAHFGNYTYKNPKLNFLRNDDNFSFVCTVGGKTYEIPASNRGVYFSIVATFGMREISVDELYEYQVRSEFPHETTRPELCFFGAYVNQLRRMDDGANYFEFTPFDFLDAVNYIRHINNIEFILNDQYLSECEIALQKYRLKFVVEKIGWGKLDKIFVKLVKDGAHNLFERIEQATGIKVEELFCDLKTARAGRSGIKDLEEGGIVELFEYPTLVSFSAKAQDEIVKNILESSDLRANAESLAYYFINYMLNEDKLPYSKIFPAICRVIQDLPNDARYAEQLFWLAGDILDRCWRYIEEDEKVQKKFRDLVYELYWPRVGSLWPVIHANEFEFNEESTEKIFRDSFSFVMSLDDIDERNAEIGNLLEKCAEEINYKDEYFGMRAFCYSIKGLSAAEQFEKILKEIKPEDYYYFLSRPETIEEAEILLKELFNTERGYRIPKKVRHMVFEKLLMTPNAINVGDYILGYIDERFETFAEILSPEDIEVKIPHAEILTSLFIAMSHGITEENEFPALKSIAKKIIEFGGDEETIEASLKYARTHRRAILFQRNDLKFIKTEKLL